MFGRKINSVKSTLTNKNKQYSRMKYLLLATFFYYKSISLKNTNNNINNKNILDDNKYQNVKMVGVVNNNVIELDEVDMYMDSDSSSSDVITPPQIEIQEIKSYVD
eukprot:236317_1